MPRVPSSRNLYVKRPLGVAGSSGSIANAWKTTLPTGASYRFEQNETCSLLFCRIDEMKTIIPLQQKLVRQKLV